MLKPTVIKVDVDDSIPRIPIADLKQFQRDLKELSDDDEEKLAQGMVDDDFFVPVFVWRNWILDGHQRLLVLERRGWTLDGNVPVVPITARSKQHAAKRLLKISSHFGKVKPSGLFDFSQAFKLDMAALSTVTLPGGSFDLETFKADYFEAGNRGGNPDAFPDVDDANLPVQHCCPKCGYEWSGKPKAG